MSKPAFALAAALLSFSCAAFDLQGHRGARGLAPENTLPAFERALAIGVNTLELDVAVTADGVVVISHDTSLNPDITRDANGRWLAARGPRIKDLTFAQLQAYDVGRINPEVPYARSFSLQKPVDGTRIPTLAALFERVRALRADHVRFNVELKISPEAPQETVALEPMVDAVLKVIRDAGLRERVGIQSFDWRVVRRVRQLDPGIPTSCLTVQSPTNDSTRNGTWTAGLRPADHGDSVPRLAKEVGCSVWSPNGGALTQALVEEAHGLGLRVLPWTINDLPTMEKLLGWGVDGIITDHPDRLRALLQQRGMGLPLPIAQR